MATSANAKIQAELGQSHNAMAAMTDSGDHQIFTISGGTLWSGKSGYTPDVKPNGIASGRALISTDTSNNVVAVASCTCYLAGTLTTVSAADVTVTRPAGDSILAGTGDHKINSITINSSGEYANVAGEDGTAFSTTRGAAGGPPLIPTGSIEVGWVKLSSTGDAAVAATEIFQNSDTYTERYDFPTWTENNIGDGEKADSTAEKNAHIKFDKTLDTRHTGSVTKAVYIEYYEPEFSDLPDTFGFKPVKNSASVSSRQLYGNKTKGSTSKSIGTGGFSIELGNGITDGILAEEGEVLTFKFFPDQDKSAYSLTQGTVVFDQAFPVDTDNTGSATIAAEQITSNFSS